MSVDRQERSPEPGSGVKEAPAGTTPEVSSFHDRLAADGARISAPHGRPRIARFGDVKTEHGHLFERAALVDDTDRVLVEVFGRRARQMLTGLLTNELPPAGEARAVYTYLLTARGRPVAEGRVLPREENRFWLDVPAACEEGLLEHLDRTLPPLYARFERRPEVVRLAMVGPRAREAIAAWPGGPGDSAGDLPPLALVPPAREDAGWLVIARREPEEGPGFDVYLRAADLDRGWRDLVRAVEETTGGGPAGGEAYDIWRIERGVPAYGSDIGPDNLPQETGQQGRAISLSKGCFTGQEVVARIHYRGHVNRHLRGLRLPGPGEGELARGEELYRDARAVGTVTSSARSPRLGPIGLGYVRREVGPGERLARTPEGHPEVEVLELPFTVK